MPANSTTRTVSCAVAWSVSSDCSKPATRRLKPGAAMRTSDESFEHLRAAIDQLVASDAAKLLAEARGEARARVRSMLSDAFAQSMIEHVRERLEAPAT